MEEQIPWEHYMKNVMLNKHKILFGRTLMNNKPVRTINILKISQYSISEHMSFSTLLSSDLYWNQWYQTCLLNVLTYAKSFCEYSRDPWVSGIINIKNYHCRHELVAILGALN